MQSTGPAAATGEWWLGRRPALDGLRGLAILLVILGHVDVPWLMSGAPVGVTVFFVLSGFLITGILVEEHARSGRIRLLAFAARRARRLLPALVVSTLLYALVGTALGDWWGSAADAMIVFLYLANWIVAVGGDLGAFGTTWSLAVEEQFYLVWPVTVALLLPSRRRLVAVAGVLALASVVARVALVTDGAAWQRIYCGTDSVAFALLVGAVVFCFRSRGGSGTSSVVLVAGAGAAVVGLWVVLPFMTMVVLGPILVAAATAVALWGMTGQEPLRVLEHPALRWFGTRSYGIYLFHGPLLWALRDHYGLPTPVLAGIGVPLSLFLAEASWRWIERPFTTRRVGRPAGAPGPGIVVAP